MSVVMLSDEEKSIAVALAAPFHPDLVKNRTENGRSYDYVTARTVMNRFDEVFGPFNWWDEYRPGEHSVLGRITVRLPDGRLVTKEDMGSYSENMKEEGDAEKSGVSDALKRAAIKFGVGRYLYKDGIPGWIGDALGDEDRRILDDFESGRTSAGPSRGGYQGGGGYNRSQGGGGGGYNRQQGAQPSSGDRGRPQGGGGDPKNGRQLWAHLSEFDKANRTQWREYLQNWGTQQGFPDRMIQWEERHTQAALSELRSRQQEHGGPTEDDNIPY